MLMYYLEMHIEYAAAMADLLTRTQPFSIFV